MAVAVSPDTAPRHSPASYRQANRRFTEAYAAWQRVYPPAEIREAGVVLRAALLDARSCQVRAGRELPEADVMARWHLAIDAAMAAWRTLAEYLRS